MKMLVNFYLAKKMQVSFAGSFIEAINARKHIYNFDSEVYKGIFLNQLIEDFTISHPSIVKSRQRLHSKHLKYSNAIIDIFYDHFLAKNWSKFTNTPLDIFASESYANLLNNYDILPYKAKCMLPEIINKNWLLKYKTVAGIQQIMNGSKVKYSIPQNAIFIVNSLEDLLSRYSEFEEDFYEFFPSLVNYIKGINQFMIFNKIEGDLKLTNNY